MTPNAPFSKWTATTALSSTSTRSWPTVDGIGLHGLDRTHVPLQQVNGVDPLVHERAARHRTPTCLVAAFGRSRPGL